MVIAIKSMFCVGLNCFILLMSCICWIFSSAKESFQFLTRYLATFSGEESHTLNESKEEAARAIVEFVKAPDMFQVCVCLGLKMVCLAFVVIFSSSFSLKKKRNQPVFLFLNLFKKWIM